MMAWAVCRSHRLHLVHLTPLHHPIYPRIVAGQLATAARQEIGAAVTGPADSNGARAGQRRHNGGERTVDYIRPRRNQAANRIVRLEDSRAHRPFGIPAGREVGGETIGCRRRGGFRAQRRIVRG